MIMINFESNKKYKTLCVCVYVHAICIQLNPGNKNTLIFFRIARAYMFFFIKLCCSCSLFKMYDFITGAYFK